MNGSGLQRFARQMQNCDLTLAKMGWSEDLNNGETLLQTVDCLPQFMQLQWVEKVESILKLGMRPPFSGLTRFVQHIIESKQKSRDLPKTVVNEA